MTSRDSSPKRRAFSQVIYIQSIEPQTVLSAGYRPHQIKNLLIIVKAQRKVIYTKILSKVYMVVKVSKLEVDFLSVLFYKFDLDCWSVRTLIMPLISKYLATVTPVTSYLGNLLF